MAVSAVNQLELVKTELNLSDLGDLDLDLTLDLGLDLDMKPNCNTDLFVGQTFKTFAALKGAVAAYGHRNHTWFVKDNCRKSRFVDDMYIYASFVCKHGGRMKKTKGKGIRTNFCTNKCGCPVAVKATAMKSPSTGQCVYRLTKVVLTHNHDVSEAIYKSYPEVRRAVLTETLKSLLVNPTVSNQDIRNYVQETQGKMLYSSDIRNMRLKQRSIEAAKNASDESKVGDPCDSSQQEVVEYWVVSPSSQQEDDVEYVVESPSSELGEDECWGDSPSLQSHQGNATMEEFIKMVEQRPALWQKSHPEFTNRLVRSIQLTELGQAVGMDANACAKKLKNAKDTMRLHVSKLPLTPSGSPDFSASGQVTWPFFNQMLFMKEEFLGKRSAYRERAVLENKMKISTKEFITMIRDRPALWQRNHTDFLNREMRVALFTEVGKVAGMTVAECTRKLKNLKDTMRLQVAKLPRTSAGMPMFSSSHGVVRWRYYKTMLFMKEEFTLGPAMPSLELECDNHEQGQMSELDSDDYEVTVYASEDEEKEEEEEDGEKLCPDPGRAATRTREPVHSTREVSSVSSHCWSSGGGGHPHGAKRPRQHSSSHHDVEEQHRAPQVGQDRKDMASMDELDMFALDIANDLRKLKNPLSLIQAKAKIRRIAEEFLVGELLSSTTTTTTTTAATTDTDTVVGGCVT